MGNKLYVGNLGFAVNEGTLESFFTENGVEVEKVDLIRDVSTGRSRGFAFVLLKPGQDFQKAIEVTNGKEMSGRQINVSEARERSSDSRGYRPSGDRGRKGRGDRGGGGQGGRRRY
jgi:RNA recognition motif-containing protein